MGRCGWLWVVVDRFGFVVDRCGWLWVVLGRFGWFLVLVTTTFINSLQENSQSVALLHMLVVQFPRSAYPVLSRGFYPHSTHRQQTAPRSGGSNLILSQNSV